MDHSGPIRKRFDGTNAVNDTKHPTERLLAHCCEQRLSVWEAKISRAVAQPGGTFPALDSRQSDGKDPWYKIAAVDKETLSRFALSIFWRSSVCSHRQFSASKLGATAENQIASVLLGCSHMPEEMSLLVRLFDPPEDRRPFLYTLYFHPHVITPTPILRIASLPFLGMHFVLFVGHNPPRGLKRKIYCFARSGLAWVTRGSSEFDDYGLHAALSQDRPGRRHHKVDDPGPSKAG